MNFDTFSVAGMAAELRSVLMGGRVQKVTQLNSLTYGFEIYVYPVRHYLLISVEPQAPRLHLTDDRLRRGVGHDTPLMMVLRKYMRGAILETIDQPPYERLLYFSFKSTFGKLTLAVELMGTRSNLLLLEADQTILGVARLPKAGQEYRRQLLPGRFYELPAPQQKLSPTEVDETTLRQELAEASPQLKLTRLLPRVVSGVSPFIAREIVQRATGRLDSTVADLDTTAPFLEAFQAVFTYYWSNEWQPTLVVDEDDNPIAFAPHPVQHLPHTRPCDSFSEAVETYFAEVTTGYAAAKIPLAEALEAAKERVARRRERLQEDAAAQADPETLKTKGEAILAFAHEIEPRQTEFVAEWGFGQSPLTVKLDPALSASENAQQYFSRYRKAQRAGEEIPVQLKRVDLEAEYLAQLEQDLAMAENRPEIDAIAEALAEAGYYKSRRRRRKQQKRHASRATRLTAPDGATVWVGKNALQNAHLTFNRASGDDLWLHARDVPGAHVILPTAQGLPSEEDVFWAAAVAAYYSKARHDTSVEVDVTLKKYVRAIKGAAPGLVTYRNESTLRVVPEMPEA